MGVVTGIRFSPLVLIERLNYMVVLGECLSQTVGKHYFTIGKMAQDLPDAPLSRSRRFLQAFGTQLVGKGVKSRCGSRNDFKRVAISKERCVWIHLETIPFLRACLNPATVQTWIKPILLPPNVKEYRFAGREITCAFSYIARVEH